MGTEWSLKEMRSVFDSLYKAYMTLDTYEFGDRMVRAILEEKIINVIQRGTKAFYRGHKLYGWDMDLSNATVHNNEWFPCNIFENKSKNSEILRTQERFLKDISKPFKASIYQIRVDNPYDIFRNGFDSDSMFYVKNLSTYEKYEFTIRGLPEFFIDVFKSWVDDIEQERETD